MQQNFRGFFFIDFFVQPKFAGMAWSAQQIAAMTYVLLSVYVYLPASLLSATITKVLLSDCLSALCYHNQSPAVCLSASLSALCYHNQSPAVCLSASLSALCYHNQSPTVCLPHCSVYRPVSLCTEFGQWTQELYVWIVTLISQAVDLGPNL